MYENLDKRAQITVVELEALRERAEKAEEACAEMQATFDLRWKADMSAINAWQEKTGETLTWPDHADLCIWLLERIRSLPKSEQTIQSTDRCQ
jgi:hypothetical protein